MAKDDLKSFKIGDAHRPGMSRPTARTKGEETSDPANPLGFTRIEQLLDDEDPAKVGENLNQVLEKLQTRLDSVSSPRDKNAVQKAMAAVERTIDLLDFLYQIKHSMENDANPS